MKRTTLRLLGVTAVMATVTLTAISLPDLPTVTITAQADDSDLYIVDGRLNHYSGTGGDVVIPDGITSIDSSVFRKCTGLTSITIPDSVTNIGESAFYGCTGLTSITIPDSVTNIGGSAFYGCTGLTSITVPDSVTNIGAMAFTDCSGLTSVKLPANLTFLDELTFAGCSSLKTIELPETVTGMGYGMFKNCSGLESVDIPDRVTSIGEQTFYNCTSLESVDIPDGVTSIGEQAFYYCTSMTSVTIPDSVTTIDAMAFYGCDNLTKVVISENVTSIGQSAFKYCNQLNVYYMGTKEEWQTIAANAGSVGKTIHYNYDPENPEASDFNITDGVLTSYIGEGGDVVIPEGVTSIADYAFANNSAVTSVVIPEGVTSIGSAAFSYCNGLNSVEIPTSVTSIGNLAFMGCTSLRSVTIPTGVSSIEYATFYNCQKLSSVTIPEGVIFIENTAFYGCSSLYQVEFPTSLKGIGMYAFEGCNLISISIPAGVTKISSDAFLGNCMLSAIQVDAGNTVYDSRNSCNAIIETATGTLILGCAVTEIPEDVKKIGKYAFYQCENLMDITIPESVTTIDVCAFAECSDLSEIHIPAGVTSISDDSFYMCSGLQIITVDEKNPVYDSRDNCNALIETASGTLIKGCNFTVVPDGVKVIGRRAFDNCAGLQTFSLPDSVTSILSHAYDGCGFTEITIPGQITYIGDGVFQDCTRLKSVTIEEGVPLVEYGDFQGCSALESVKIPCSVTKLGTYAFAKCPALTTIEYAGTEEEWGAVEISDYVFFSDTQNIQYRFHEHTPEVLPAVEASYASTGLTEGSYCSTCNRTLVAQEVVARKKLDAVKISSMSNTVSGVTFGWNQVEGAEGYRIYRKTGSNGYSLYKVVTDPSTTSFTDSAVVSGTSYTYAVRAYAGSNYSSYTGKSVKYLSAGMVSALVNYSAGIQVQWSKVTGAGGYYIYRKAGSESKWSRVATVTSGSTVKWNDTTVKSGVKYQYCVKAYSGSTMSAYKSGKTTYRITTPTISSATNSAAGKATVKWNKNTTVTGYQISYTTGNVTKTVTVSGNANVSKVISGLAKGKTYTIQVRAYRKVGSTTYYSGWSARKSVKISK